MVTPRQDSFGRRFGAILVDFDSATYKPELRALEEGSLIEKDIRLLVRLIGFLTFETKWHEPLQELLRGCTTARWGQEMFGRVLQIVRKVDGVSAEELDDNHWADVVRIVLCYQLVGGHNGAMLRTFMYDVAAKSGVSDRLDRARDALLHRMETDRNYPEESFSLDSRHFEIESAAESLFY